MKRYIRANDVFSPKTLEACRNELNEAGYRGVSVRFPAPKSTRGAAMPTKLAAIRAVVQAKIDGATYSEAGLAATPHLGRPVTRQTASDWCRKYRHAVETSNDHLIAATAEEV
jgi:hypothetical protein